LLSELVEKSLVVAEPEPEGRQRYRLLETLRQYGQERLIAAGEMETLRERHATYYRDLALAAEPHLLGSEQLIYLARLDCELDNLRAALRWYLDHTRVQDGLRFQLGLVHFWWFRGRVTELHLWFDRFLALPAAAERTALRAIALGWAGHGAVMRGEQRAFQSLSEEAIALAREIGDRPALAETLFRYAVSLEPRAARQLFEDSLAIWRELGDRWQVAGCLAGLGRVARAAGDLKEARLYLHESLAIARGLGERHQTAFALEVLGDLESAENPTEALFYLTESQTLNRELGDLMGVASIEFFLGRLDWLNGHAAPAQDHFRACLRQSRDLSWMVRIIQSIEGLALVAIDQGQPERALRLGGAGACLRQVANQQRWPSDLVDELRHRLEPPRGPLGNDVADANWAEGQAMTLDQAVTHALEEAED
jgi:tetratricopeptide (TPR) repeat protein